MPLPVLTPELLRSVERFGPAFQRSRLGAGRDAMPELGIEFRDFGASTAIRVEADFLRSKNQVVGFTKADLVSLPEIAAFFREIGRGFTLTLPFDGADAETFDALAAVGMRCAGGGAMATAPEPAPKMEFTIRRSPPEERAVYLDLYRRAFGTRREVTSEELGFQWIEDSIPAMRRYVAEIDGEPVAMAGMAVIQNVAYLATCGVLPEWRGRGVQQAMIRARVADAHAAGCVLSLGGGTLLSPPRRNFERCGFGLLPLGLSWSMPTP